MSTRTKRDRSGKSAKKTFAGQQDGEKVLVVERKYPIVLRRPLIYGMLLMILALLPWAIASYNSYDWIGYGVWWMVAVLVVLFWYWIRAWVGWYYTVYVLTNQRILIVGQKGFFSREVNDLTLNNIQNVNYKISGFQAAMFGFGTVTIETLSGGKPIKLKYIHGPAEFAQSISQVSRVTQS
jgi:uncharacterized membrane protein YdbT with pleckstrin-like domain